MLVKCLISRAGEELAKDAASGVGPGVVGQHPLTMLPWPPVAGEGALEEACGRGRTLIVVDLLVGEARVIVDDGVHDVEAVQMVAVL